MSARRRPHLRLLLVIALLLSGAVTACGGDEQPSPGDTDFLTSGNITLEDQGWVCGGKVDIDRLEVTVRNRTSTPSSSVPGCTGRIGELDVTQYRQDGVKVAEGAYDLVIETGTVECLGRKDGAHQDGVQALGGERRHVQEPQSRLPERDELRLLHSPGRDLGEPADRTSSATTASSAAAPTR